MASNWKPRTRRALDADRQQRPTRRDEVELVVPGVSRVLKRRGIPVHTCKLGE